MHVLFEDHHLIAVNKPAPLMTQAPEGVPSLEAMAKASATAASGDYQPVSGTLTFGPGRPPAGRAAQPARPAGPLRPVGCVCGESARRPGRMAEVGASS